ncbi:MAG: 2-dehydro-3-deoxygalactonokinase [Brevundimonas sp.]|uniref:2-dehydro-3-deoxygalactonokinase n=1 Tax=Brevundimonas sp. TaxID=1871086 RepID=UPI0027324DEA|nr:2-dehydro-3-deoxygalactonokinase [Brevundimonas sp.]MDP3405281.1 2-dehydro-3-deoxygalactonokinase [Brevundimonas sp.]
MNDGAQLIGVDWGTSNLRVMRIAPGGDILAARSDPRGAGGLAADAFPNVLAEVARDWLSQGLPVLACGMAGARGKWREMPYRPTPTSLAALAAAVASPPDRADVMIVPGVSALFEGRLIDVMRGEETQVMGLDLDGDDHVVVAPGTHSKWISVQGGAITGFRTFLTGELFAAIRTATVIGAGMGERDTDAAAFEAGVTRALADPALTALLFSVRVETLAERLPAEAAADYLSGLLIGAEIAAQADRTRAVTLVGAGTLNQRYATALSVAGFTEVHSADGPAATARGLWRIHEARP